MKGMEDWLEPWRMLRWWMGRIVRWIDPKYSHDLRHVRIIISTSDPILLAQSSFLFMERNLSPTRVGMRFEHHEWSSQLCRGRLVTSFTRVVLS
jgi:hypothetical protein